MKITKTQLKQIIREAIINEGRGFYYSKPYFTRPSKEQLKKSAERRDNKEKWFAEKIKNPETGKDISVKTALSYPSNHPARIAAVKMGKEKFKVGGFGYSDHFTRSGKPKEPKQPEKSSKEAPKQNIFGKLKDLFKESQNNNSIKITKTQLKQIIREEIKRMSLKEAEN